TRKQYSRLFHKKKSVHTFFLSIIAILRYVYRFVISVAEENLSEAEESEKGRFEHPYTEFLFYGEDTARDFIPVKQLREKYDQPRYEASGDENDDDGTTNS
uniref:Uncharacterized protein n=1 Tax=Aegilops tauschii subsp. strangulata TaxID=200361 RepID=A0A453FKQ9_AEGTS